MKKRIIYLLLSISLSACLAKYPVIGKYGSDKTPYGFNINADSTYDYRFYQLHGYEYSNGNWHRENKATVILNSVRRNIRIPLTLVESVVQNKDKINRFSFEFNSPNIADKDCECAIIINDTTKEIRRCDSIKIVVINEPVWKLFVEVRKSTLLMTSFRFSLDPLTTNVYSTSKEYGNLAKFRITVNDSLFSYKVFDNQAIKIKKRGIYFYDNKGEKKHWIPKME